jgi:hypothetical protein
MRSILLFSCEFKTYRSVSQIRKKIVVHNLETRYATRRTGLVTWWSDLLTTSHEVPGSIPGSAMGIFPCRGRSG